MASISKKPNGSYMITVSDGRDMNGKQVLRRMTYKPKGKSQKAIDKELTSAAALFEERVKNGEFLSGDKMKFKEFMEKWIDEWAVTHLTPRVQQDYIAMIEKHGLPVFGNMPIGKIKSAHIQGIITDLNKDHAPTSVRKIVSAFSSVFQYAYRMDVIKENPVRRCEQPRMKHDTDLHFFTADQAKRFLKAIQEPQIYTYRRRNGTVYTEERYMQTQLKAFFFLAIYSGCRRGELLALTWRDIDFRNCKLSITKATSKLRTGEQEIKDPKTVKGVRELRLPKQCFEILRRWHIEEKELCLMLGEDWKGKSVREFDDNFIFIVQTSGEQMHTDTPYQSFQRFIKHYNNSVRKKDKLPEITLHDLRHTSATLLLSEGMDIEEVSRRLGHSKPSVTLDVYGHALPEKDDEAAGILGSLLG